MGYKLFVVSIMQEDVFISYTALALTLGLVFSLTGATTTGRLLGPRHLPHEDGDIPLSAQGHKKQACRIVLHIISNLLSAKQGSCEYHFLKSFGMTRLGE